jgi:hypothetical protein
VYTYIEPSQATSRFPEDSTLCPTGAWLKPIDGQHPILGLYSPEIVLLVVQRLVDVVAEQGEEAGNGECLVAVSQDFPVYRMEVKFV